MSFSCLPSNVKVFSCPSALKRHPEIFKHVLQSVYLNYLRLQGTLRPSFNNMRLACWGSQHTCLISYLPFSRESEVIVCFHYKEVKQTDVDWVVCITYLRLTLYWILVLFIFNIHVYHVYEKGLVTEAEEARFVFSCLPICTLKEQVDTVWHWRLLQHQHKRWRTNAPRAKKTCFKPQRKQMWSFSSLEFNWASSDRTGP